MGVVDSTNVATYKYDAVGNVLSIARYSAATVSIIQITPGSAASGTSVLIYGSAFSTTPSQNTVTFNGTTSVVTSSTATQIVTTVPAGATTGSVKVTTPAGSATSAAPFTVAASLVPTITALSATIATAGSAVTVIGTNFQGILTNNDTLFNTTHAIVTAEAPTSLTVAAPPSGGSGHVTVITPYGQATSAADFFVPPAPYTPASVGVTSRMALGDSKTYTFGTASQIGLFLFDGTAGQRFSLNISFSLSGPDPLANLWVYNPDGSVLVPHAVGGCCLFVDSTVMPQTGTYMFVIDPGRDTGTAIFSLYNVPPDNTGTITMGGPSVTLGNTVPGQDASLYFSGTAGQQISVTGSSTFSNNGSVTLMNPDGTTLLSSGPLACCLFFDRTTLPQTGTYRFFIDAGGPAVGNATLTLYNVPPDNTGTITMGGPSVTLGNTVPGQDASLYFSGTAGQQISVTGSSTFNNNGSVTLMNPDGTTLLSSGPLACCLFWDRTALPQTGTYRFFIDAGGATVGNATLTLYNVPPDVTGTITIAGPSVSISNTVPGQNMQLTFSGTTGKTINLNSSFSITSTGTCMSIYNPDGTTLVPVQCPFGGIIGPVTLQQTGTFTILIDPYQANVETATETLTDPPTPAAPVQTGVAPSHHSPPNPAAAGPRAGGPQPGELVRDQLAGPDPNDLFAGPEDWPLDRTNFGGDWTMPRGAASTWRLFRPLQAAPGVTALAGQVLKLNGAPLADVTLSFQGRSASSDMTGRFLITGVVGGTDVLRIDGSTADRSNRAYGIYEVRTEVPIGKTTVLPYTIWMTRLDLKNAVTIPSPTTKETIVSTPVIPGLQVVLPAGSVVKDDSGEVVTQLSITPVPVNRPPFPLPAGVVVPLYFTVQPGSTYIFPKGARIIYPNYTHEKPGTRVNFWNYDPDQKGWYIYGQGSVTADGSQVVPDPGVVVWQFTGAMINVIGFLAAILGPILHAMGIDGDPVDLGTGLFVMRKTDLVVADIMPLALTRTYRTGDSVSRDFGIGSTNPYDLFLSSTNQYQLADLNLPDGGQIHYVRTSSGTGFTDAVFQTTTTASQYYKSTIAWNGNGWNLSLKDGTVYVFGANQPLQAIRDRHGNQITIIRTGGQAGNVIEILSPNGRWITFSYDASNRITQAQDNIGQSVTYTYDSAGHLWKVTDPNGGITTYTYDSVSGGMQTLQDARNIVFLTNAYDVNGRVMKQTQNDQTTYQFSYVLSSGKVIEADVTDPRGIQRKVTFNSDGYMLSDTSAVGAPEQQVVTLSRQAGTNFISSVTDALNRQTTLGYDSMGNVTTVTCLAGTPNAVTALMTYEPTFNQLSSVTDPLTHQTLLAYDSNGNLKTVTDALQQQTTAYYNYFGQPTSVKDPAGNVTQLQYGFGDLVAVVDPLGNTTRGFVDGAGRLVGSTDPLGGTVRTDYDALNRPTQVTDTTGAVTSFTYDQNSDLKSVKDARTNTTSYLYDNMDRLQTRTDPLLTAESYVHDNDGNVTQLTDRKGQVAIASYDNLNRPNFIGFGKTISHGVTSYQSTITYTYDGGDRPTKVVDSLAGTITPVFDGLDRLSSETTPQGQVTYTYDNANRRATMLVAGQPQIIYGYDNANRLTSITQGTTVVTPSYDNAGRLASLTLPNGVVMTYGYNVGSQLTSIAYAKGSTTLGDLSYSYDATGHRIGEAGAFARTNFPAALTSASYNGDNQLTAWGSTSLNYDANGNMTSDGTNTYTWDARNQLSSVGTKRTSSTFQYDAYGRRIQKTIGGTTTGFLYDGANPVQELSGSTPTANMLTGLGADQYLTRTDPAGTRSLLPDALGSTVALTDANGAVQTSYTYEPYGNTTASGATSSSSYQFTGRENDGTGLYYYRARYYNPTFGRFASEDPMGFAAGDPNLYGYAGGSPANATDPTGEFVPILLAAAEILAPVAIGCLSGAAFSIGIDLLSHPLGVRKSDMPAFTQKVAHDAVVGCLAGAIMVPVLGKAADLLGAAGGPAVEGIGGIETPYGVARQAGSADAQALGTEIENGATVYRQGMLGVQQTAEGQFWAPENPLTTPSFANGYGTPGNAAPEWVMGGQLGPSESFVTRPAPGLGNNTGGRLEVVTRPGGVRNLWFHMP